MNIKTMWVVQARLCYHFVTMTCQKREKYQKEDENCKFFRRPSGGFSPNEYGRLWNITASIKKVQYTCDLLILHCKTVMEAQLPGKVTSMNIVGFYSHKKYGYQADIPATGSNPVAASNRCHEGCKRFDKLAALFVCPFLPAGRQGALLSSFGRTGHASSSSRRDFPRIKRSQVPRA